MANNATMQLKAAGQGKWRIGGSAHSPTVVGATHVWDVGFLPAFLLHATISIVRSGQRGWVIGRLLLDSLTCEY